MNLSGWGNFPKTQANVYALRSENSLSDLNLKGKHYIARGNGRSYGDSALSDNVVSLLPQNYFIGFNENKGILTAQAGVMLSEIIEAFLPRGWFLKVTPGTKLITLGGAIASDVHGKNHHIEGCFSECVVAFELMLPSGDKVYCSREKNAELFKATCGGMGLTGIILTAEIALKKVNSSQINQTTIKTANLQETFEAFEEHKNASYSVAWIDCLAKQKSLGRCLLTVGEFAEDKVFDYQAKTKIDVPINFPSFALNQLSVGVFNQLYYAKTTQAISHQKVTVDSFFYPLDAIGHWNKIYGKKGFIQYQFILPLETSYKGLKAILNKIADSKMGSFLAVLKLYGKQNDNYLSFPMEGYSLALDFKIQPGLMTLLNRLDQVVESLGGRIYLAKDARMSQSMFESGYHKLNEFKTLRNDYQLSGKLQSLQSQRLGI